MVKDDHSVEVNAFAMDRLNEWFPFFIRVMSKPLPDSADTTYEGCVTLNIQVIRVRQPAFLCVIEFSINNDLSRLLCKSERYSHHCLLHIFAKFSE